MYVYKKRHLLFIHSSHWDLKTWKTWKMGTYFAAKEKSANYDQTAENFAAGKLGENIEKSDEIVSQKKQILWKYGVIL